jgi:hypothetical protein
MVEGAEMTMMMTTIGAEAAVVMTGIIEDEMIMTGIGVEETMTGMIEMTMMIMTGGRNY